MIPNNLYTEEIKSRTTLFGSIIFILTSLFILWYQSFIESFHHPILIGISIIIIVICLVLINFSRMTIGLTSREITIRYGIFGRTESWQNVKAVTYDETPMIGYLGWGIRIIRFRGKWRLIFNVMGEKCVILHLNQGRFREFVFSTNSPDEIIKIIREKTLQKV
ncbi:MAG: hypothetical protein ACFFFG_16510 [Candidatus Thorarchaeota archaeon]